MLTLLAQSYFAAPDALPEPGFVELWLNQRGMITGIGLIALGAIVAIGSGGSKGGRLAGLIVAVLGGAVWGFGEFYESDLERVRSGAAAFYEAARSGDRAAAESLLASEVGIAAGGSTLLADGREWTLSGIDRLENANLTELSIVEGQATVDSETAARTQTQLRAVFGGGGPNLVWVRLDWRKSGGEWRIRGIDVLLVNGQSPGSILRGAL